uniref:DUF243 domain-containing protein n=1 Tax=Stomoxys calcitrans TaxID=35570 RepID=A0A1I8P8V0_STOCA
MRTLIVLCLVAVACAQYNYQPSNGQTSEGAVGGVGSDAGGAGLSGGGDVGSEGAFAPGSDAGFGGGATQGGDSGGVAQNAGSFAPQAEFEKEFFTYTADENEFGDNDAAQQAANSLRQGIRVVFIRGPENRGLENAALALAKQAGEQKTAIYVLNKQADIGDLANKLNSINHSSNNKPEVHFVKYRTAEDAANAQRAIQGQYDGLGGNARSINGGVAPVLNFASQGPRAPSSSNFGSAGGIAGPSSSYIPPSSAAPSNSYVPPQPQPQSQPQPQPQPQPQQQQEVAPTSSYIPPPASAAAPTNTYVSPPAPSASAPTNSYIPPATPVDEPSPNYLPASILRLFRL